MEDELFMSFSQRKTTFSVLEYGGEAIGVSFDCIYLQFFNTFFLEVYKCIVCMYVYIIHNTQTFIYSELP